MAKRKDRKDLPIIDMSKEEREEVWDDLFIKEEGIILEFHPESYFCPCEMQGDLVRQLPQERWAAIFSDSWQVHRHSLACIIRSCKTSRLQERQI